MYKIGRETLVVVILMLILIIICLFVIKNGTMGNDPLNYEAQRRRYDLITESLPATPCREIFNYGVDGTNNEKFGILTFDNDQSGHYHLSLNMSLNGFTNEKLKIELATTEEMVFRGERIKYIVVFPPKTIPHLTMVNFNYKTVCLGPVVEGPIVITLTASYTFRNPRLLELAQLQSVHPQIYQQQSEFLQQKTSHSQSRLQYNIKQINKDLEKEEPSQYLVQNFIYSRTKEMECGDNFDVRPLVLNGQTTKEGEYPWLVAMFYSEDETYRFRCAGTLISDKHVITAAHCVKTGDVDWKKILLLFGRQNIKNWAANNLMQTNVKKIVLHPDYAKMSGDADIAVIFVSPVTFGTRIKPICLWDESISLSSIVGETGTVAGWGRDETGKSYVYEPKQIAIPIVTQEICLRSDSRFLELTSNRTFCAGARDGKIPCTGDSGGGFVMKRNGKWKLRGVVSTALSDPVTKSCDGNNYVVFSDVPKYSEWLLEVLEED